jgi:hypothetical protein
LLQRSTVDLDDEPFEALQGEATASSESLAGLPDDALASPPAPFDPKTSLRQFKQEARLMTRQEREKEGARLMAEADRLAASGELVGNQLVFTKIAILKDTYPNDPERLAEEAAKVRAEREAQLAARPPIDHGPDHARYKEREAEIVREVLAMDTYPDGLDRDAYLARRLAEVRAELYGEE